MEELLFQKELDEYFRRGGKITKLKYHGPKEPEINMKVKKKRKIKGLNK